MKKRIFVRKKKEHRFMSEQIERIQQMESLLDTALAAIKEMATALDHFAAAQGAIAALDDYYGSDEWQQDFDADREGRLPDGLKRGVLSEDGIWDLLNDNRELLERMKSMPRQPAATAR